MPIAEEHIVALLAEHEWSLNDLRETIHQLSHCHAEQHHASDGIGDDICAACEKPVAGPPGPVIRDAHVDHLAALKGAVHADR